MSKRSCGECTACCEGWLYSDIPDMRPGRPCRHRTDQGCAIYADRPEDPCVRYICGWLTEDSPLPEDFRPDRSGVIVHLKHQWRDWNVIMAIPAGPSVPDTSLDWLRQYAQREHRPLVFHERLTKDGLFIGVRARAFGSPAFADYVKYTVGPEDIVRM